MEWVQGDWLELGGEWHYSCSSRFWQSEVISGCESPSYPSLVIKASQGGLSSGERYTHFWKPQPKGLFTPPMALRPCDDQTWLDSLTTPEDKQSWCFRRFLEVSNMLSLQALLFVDIFEIYSQTWSYLEKTKHVESFLEALHIKSAFAVRSYQQCFHVEMKGQRARAQQDFRSVHCTGG